MKRLTPTSQGPRYRGGLRHFHRPRTRRSSWDQWVDGEVRESRPVNKWVKVLAVIAALVALGAITVGLIHALGRS